MIRHDRRAQSLPNVAHQIEDSRLDRHVERRRRLVGDEQTYSEVPPLREVAPDHLVATSIQVRIEPPGSDTRGRDLVKHFNAGSQVFGGGGVVRAVDDVRHARRR